MLKEREKKENNKTLILSTVQGENKNRDVSQPTFQFLFSIARNAKPNESVRKKKDDPAHEILELPVLYWVDQKKGKVKRGNMVGTGESRSVIKGGKRPNGQCKRNAFHASC